MRWMAVCIFILAACTARELQPWESFAEKEWEGFEASTSQSVAVGWCVTGERQGPAAVWVIPHQRGYLLKRTYQEATCTLPDLPYEELVG